MSLAKKAISGTFWMSGISYLGFAVNFAIQLALVRVLVPEDFGLFAIGLAIAEILFIFFNFSFPLAVLQIQKAENLFDTAFYLSLFSGLIIILIGSVLSLILSYYYPMQSVLAFFVLCILQPFQGCSAIYSASMAKELQFKKIAIVRGATMNLAGIGAIYFAYSGFGVWSLVGREIITSILLLCGMRLVSYYRFKRKFSRETAKMLCTFGYKMLFSRGLEKIYHRLPYFLIGTFAGTKALGLFSQTYYLANLPNTLLGPANQNVAYAVYSKIQNDTAKTHKAFYITNYFSIRILLPFMLVLLLFPETIIRVLYGDQWIEASSILACFAAYAAFLPLFSNAKSYSFGLGKLLDVSKAYLIQIIFLTMGLFIALYTGKIYLGAAAYSMSIIVGLFAVFSLLKKDNMELYIKELFLAPVVTSLFIVIIYLLLLSVINIPFPQNRIYSFFFLLIITLTFTTLILMSEPKRTFDKFKYIRKKSI